MFPKSTIACLLLCLTGVLRAQTPALPPDLSSMSDEIKSLKWQTVDLNAASPLDRCRSLLMLNHVLDDVSANATSEADLMSAYIQKQNLGQQFAGTLPPPPAKQLSFEDAQKIALALLHGPMSKSFYATELADSTESGLSAYEQMYMRTCNRRWSEVDEARHQVRAMGSFLGNSQKLTDFEAWATAEVALRQKQYELRPAGAAAPAPQVNTGPSQENNQLRQALAAAEFQQQSQAQQTAQAQQQTAAAQQQAAQAQQQTAQAQQQTAQTQQQQPYSSAYEPTYGVYTGYGAYAAGAYTANAVNNANAANAAKNANQQVNHPAAAGAAAGQYHGSNSSYNRDSSYNSAARSQTEQRMSSFHGAGGRR